MEVDFKVPDICRKCNKHPCVCPETKGEINGKPSKEEKEKEEVTN